MDSVDLLAPHPGKWFNYGTRIAQRLATDYAIGINPGIPKIKILKNYDLFFAFCQFPRDLLHIERIDGWKDCCKTSICWLSEIWVNDIYNYRYYLKVLSKFDHVILNLSQSVDEINKKIGNKGFYLPLGIDSILFSPYPSNAHRTIDVYSIGRRSEETHRVLLKMFEENKIFYIYDTIVGSKIKDTEQHRFLFANMAKRSKYFIVNPGKIDIPSERKSQSEIGNRYFEGLAAGTIMIGEHPENEEFKKIFCWEDAVVLLPFNSDKIRKIIDELECQPHRQQKIRTRNVIESLMKHDWAYRWETVLKTADLEPLPELLERKNILKNLSTLVGKFTNEV